MKAVVYARYSSDNQREESIDAQLRAIRDFAEKENIVIVREYTDEARSATTDKRPGFQQMIAEVKELHVEAVIVHKLDRFSRDRYDSAFYKRELKRAGVRLISVLEHLDDSPESIILESVLEGMSEYYSRNLAREALKGMKETAYQCKHTGGVPPLGYTLNPDKTYAVDPLEAETVRIIFSLYAEGRGYSEIIDALRGRRTKTGKPFAKNSISAILRNEKYTGTFIFNRATAKVAGKRNTHASKPEDEIIRIPGGMPRIIDDDTWARVQRRLSDHKHNASNRAKRVYLLSGKIVCGKCGAVYVGKRKIAGRNKTQYAYYICGSRDRAHACDMPTISADVVERQVLDAIEQTLSGVDEGTIDTVLQRIIDQRETEPPEVRQAREALKKVQKQIASLVCAIRDGAYHPVLREELQKLADEEARLNKTLAGAEDLPLPTHEEIAAFLQKAQNIKKLSRDEQKRIIADLVDEIVVRDSGDKYLTFRIFHVPMVELMHPNANLFVFLGGFGLSFLLQCTTLSKI